MSWIRNCVGTVLALTAALVFPQQKAEKERAGNLMENQIQQVAAALAEFEKTKSLERLESAIQTLDGLDLPQPSDTAARQRAGRLWLAVLEAIDRNLDPKFDPKDVPAANVVPPTFKGITYPSGVDPTAIPDPAARAEYEAALNKNKEKADRYRFQNKLRRLDSRATAAAQTFFKRFYTTSAADQKEFDELLEKARPSPARAQKLKAIFERKP
jgi:hypothetical protein